MSTARIADTTGAQTVVGRRTAVATSLARSTTTRSMLSRTKISSRLRAAVNSPGTSEGA
jgi:hypothetical protein